MAEIQCPRCGAEAYNHYGRTKNGKKRYICLVCNRQFIGESSGNYIRKRPQCPICGKKMHVYMRNDSIIRFRCSGYPECRGYTKIAVEN